MENEHNLPETPVTIQLRPYFLVLMLLCAYLFVRGIVFAGAGISVFICAVVFATGCLYFFHSIKRPIPRNSYPYLAVILLAAISCALFENTGIKWLLFLGLLLILPYWLLILAGKRTGSSLGGHAAADVFYGAFVLPLRSVKPMTLGFGKHIHGRKNIISILLALLISIPLLLIVGSLLMSADHNFEKLIADVMDNFVDDIALITIRLILTLLVGWYLLSVLAGLKTPENTVRQKYTVSVGVPIALSCTVLCLLELLYALFFYVQMQSILAVFATSPPPDFSYSDYAREGFFELCAVAMINLCVYGAIHTFSIHKKVITRVLLITLSILTLCIISTACLKMVLYVERYGYTLLRLHTTCFMGMLFIAFCILIAGQVKTFPLAKTLIILCTITGIAIGFANTGGLVTKLNADRYLAGSLLDFDMEQYHEFPYEAVPYLVELYPQVEDESLRKEIEKGIAKWAKAARESNIPLYGKSLQRIQSERMMRAFLQDR